MSGFDFQKFIDETPEPENRVAGGGDDGSKWSAVFTEHPEGGGSFGGRDKALTAFVGFLRAKSFPFEAGRDFALDWNRRYCRPPLHANDVLEKVGRAWAEWSSGGHEDMTPEDLKPKEKEVKRGTIRTVAELLDIAKDPDKQLKWIAKDLIQEDGVTIISAPSGNGKTWLALDFCRHLSRPLEVTRSTWLEKYDLPHKRCLYMDEENGEPTMGLRLEKLGFTADNDKLFTWSDSGLKLDNAKDRVEIITAARNLAVQVIVFDSLKAFHNRDENSATEMRRVGEWLREFVIAGFCVVVLHHDKKGGNDPNGGGLEQDKTRGSGDIVAFSQTVLGLIQKDDIYYLSQRKIRNAEKSGEIIPYILAIDKSRPGGILLDVAGARTKADDEREQKREESMSRKTMRVNEAIRILESEGKTVTNDGIAKIAKMSKRDVVEIRKEVDSPSDRWDLRDE